MADQAEKQEKPEEQAAAKPVEKPIEKPAQAGEAASPEKKMKKISRMTLAEVETQLKTTKEKMGAFQSSFARHLLARKSELSENLLKKK